VKEGFGTSAKVYIRIYADSEHTYYQKIGKVSDMVYSPLDPGTDRYSTSKYFNPLVPTIQFHYEDPETHIISSYTDVVKLEVIEAYIVPSYNFDRTERRRVKLTALGGTKVGTVPGYRYKYEIIQEGTTIEDIDRMIDNNEITKICER